MIDHRRIERELVTRLRFERQLHRNGLSCTFLAPIVQIANRAETVATAGTALFYYHGAHRQKPATM